MKKLSVQDRPFGARDKVGYMFGDFGCNMSFQLITSYLMLFVTQGLGLSTALWAVLIIIAKVFDAINDPIIGALVDKRRPGKHGKYKPWIFWGSFAIAVSTALLFLDVRAFSTAGKFAYCLIMYMVWSVSYTAANVPYGSLNASLTDKPGERASLSSLRNIGAGFAMLPVLFLVPQFCMQKDEATGIQVPITENFFWLALIFGLIGIGGFMLTIFLCKERRQEQPQLEDKHYSYFKTLKNFFKNRAVVALSLASLAQIVFIQSYSITMTIVFQYYFKVEKGIMLSLANLLPMIGMMIFIPFMSKLSTKVGKKEISSWPNIASIILLIIMLFIPFERSQTGGLIFILLVMVAMTGAGPFFLATWSMVADCVDEQEVETGDREEASIYATYSLSRKVAQGIGGALTGLAIGWVGYVTSDELKTANPNMGKEELDSLVTSTNLAAAPDILRVSIILLLVGFILVFVTLLFMYNLNKDKVLENTNKLQANKEVVSLEPTKLFYEE